MENLYSVLSYFIVDQKLDFDMKHISMIRRAEELRFGDSKTLREEFQYGTEVEVEKDILESLQNNAKEFLEASEILIEKLSAK